MSLSSIALISEGAKANDEIEMQYGEREREKDKKWAVPVYAVIMA